MGTDVSGVTNAVDSSLYSGTAVQVAGGEMPEYSLDVPGYWIYSDSYRTNLLSSSANSVAFAPSNGVANSGGLLTLANLATAISAMDEGTVEFFAKSDASQSWRNIVTFNAGQPFKICFDGSRIYWQNFFMYGNPSIYNSATVSSASGIWLHIAITWSKQNNTVSNYVDHLFKNVELMTNTTTTASRPFYVGGSSTSRPGESLNGKVFGLRISNRILAPDEMLHTSYFPADDEHISVTSDGITSTNAASVLIDEGSKLKVRSGVALSATLVSYAGNTIAAGVYTGEGGASGATEVEWIDGGGTLTVAGVSSGSDAIWITKGDGDWSSAANWAGGYIPTSSRGAYLNLGMPLSYTATISAAVEAPSCLNMANTALATATVDVATGGSLDFALGSAVTVDKGGVFQVSGGSVSATGTTFTVNDGGVVRVTGGTFAFTNTTASSFKLNDGSALEMTGGEMSFAGVSFLLGSVVGSRIAVSGDSVLSLMPNQRENCGTYSDIEFSGNAQLRTYAHRFYNNDTSRDVTVTFKDSASIFLYNNSVMYIGNSVGPVTMNLDSDATTIVPYGVVLGSTSSLSTLNIRNGHYLEGRGNQNAIGYKLYSTYFGEVNVYDGAYVQRSSPQYTDCLYGISVADAKGLSNTRRIEGTLNIYPDGVVSNLSDNFKSKGAGVYLKVGTGFNAYGVINQLGGSLYHNSALQCVIGLFGGEGEWNVCSGSVATVNADVYIGGAVTNELVGFNGVGKPGNSPWNGGDNFATKYDAYAPGKGILSVVNGTFTTPSNLYASVVGEGIISVGPEDGRIEAQNVTLSNYVCEVDSVETVSNATLRVRFGDGTAGSLVASGKLTVSEGSRLILDFTDYAKSRASWFPIVQYSEREGFFADEDVEVVGEEPGGGKLVKDVSHNGVNGLWYYIPHGTFVILR